MAQSLTRNHPEVVPHAPRCRSLTGRGRPASIASMTCRTKRARLVLTGMIATFVAVRVFLYFAPNADFNVGRYNVHHLFTGLIVMAATGIALAVLERDCRLFNAITAGFGAGLGLALDELVYLIATDGSNAAYWLSVSVWGALLSIGVASAFIYALSRCGRE